MPEGQAANHASFRRCNGLGAGAELASLAKRSIGATGCLTQPGCNLIVNLADVADLEVMHPMLRTGVDHLLEPPDCS
jgi:hypothetical protein